MIAKGCGQSDVGLRRDHNEDSYHCSDELGLYIVCDGVGGHIAGEIASAAAVKGVLGQIEKEQRLLTDIREGSVEPEQGAALVNRAVDAACTEVRRRVEEDRQLAGMGTTLTMLLSLGEKMVMGHVGDSRLYLYRQGAIHQLSQDHTLVSEMLSRGLVNREQAGKSRYAHVLSRSIGAFEAVSPDVLLFDVLRDDLLLLSSDGFNSAAEQPASILPLLDSDDLESLPQRLVSVAREIDGGDNITVVAVKVVGNEDAVLVAERAEELMCRIGSLQQMFVFKHLSYEELMHVMQFTRVVKCPAGKAVISEGEEDEKGLYIILKGSFVVDHKGQEVGRLSVGNHFGEMALISRRPRTASVRALEDAEALVLESRGFSRIISSDPKIGVKMLWRLADELCVRLEYTTDLLS